MIQTTASGQEAQQPRNLSRYMARRHLSPVRYCFMTEKSLRQGFKRSG